MEMYKAISDFSAPTRVAIGRVLSFKKGDTFEILEPEKAEKVWWGARNLVSNQVGYVPAKYLKFHEKKIGKLLPENYKSEREGHIQTLRDMDDKNNSHNNALPEEIYSHVPQLHLTEPAPDYSTEEINHNGTSKHSRSVSEPGKPVGLISGHKLHNPCMESRERMQLHKELLHKTKTGDPLIKQKSELERTMLNRRETQRKKEWEDKVNSKRTSFDKKLEEQKLKLEQFEHNTGVIEEEDTLQKPEFLKVHAKIRTKSK
ncbi:unnamed protein product [Owenia fusiformis]|uniref:SH3 domain-containing protein n=1 Tax=Owenia fusiformis TaxID=6347 RepID=A0A8S4NSF1_OWEFU|nr:unnamed protein product [Owenia fusiformis]